MLVWTFVLAAVLTSGALGKDQDLHSYLLDKGVVVADGRKIKLPPPIMRDGLGALEQISIIKKASSRYPFSRFMKDSVVSPQVIHVKKLLNDKKVRVGQHINICFVAYGPMEKVTSKAFFHLSGGSKSNEPGGAARELKPEELISRGLVIHKSKTKVEEFIFKRFNIVKKVQASGVFYQTRSITKSTMVVCSRLDPRFEKDATLPNIWRPLKRSRTARKLVPGKPHTYQGMGGYMKVTQLKEPKGALFVEFHMIVSEPYEWFKGPNLLGSRLRPIFQNQVREFRRALKD